MTQRSDRQKWFYIGIVVFALIGLSIWMIATRNNNKDNFAKKLNPLPLKNMLDLVKQKAIDPPRPKPIERYIPPPAQTPVNLPVIPTIKENFEGPVDIPSCPCGLGDSCKPGCSCGKCSNVENFQTKQEVWVQNIIPISSSIRSTTRSGADVIRGDVPISSSGASQGWFKTSESNRTLEKGARQLVFGR